MLAIVLQTSSIEEAVSEVAVCPTDIEARPFERGRAPRIVLEPWEQPIDSYKGWRIGLAPNGRINYSLALPDA